MVLFSLSSFNWLGLLMGVVIAFLLGMFWYPKIFNKVLKAEMAARTNKDNAPKQMVGMVMHLLLLVMVGIFVALLFEIYGLATALILCSLFLFAALFNGAFFFGAGRGFLAVHIGYWLVSVVIFCLIFFLPI